MNRSSPWVSPWATRALYLFGLLLIVSPAGDFVTTVLPLRPGDFSWRYGAFGLMAGYLHTPMLGITLLLALSYWLGHPSVMKTVGVLSVLGAVALLGVMSVFALDVLQMRGMRAEEVQAAVLAGGVLQELKYFLAFLVLLPLGIGAWSTGSRLAPAAERRGTASAAPGIVSAGRAGS